MQYIGTYHNRKVYWFDYNNLGQLPDKDWICLITADIEPDYKQFESFVRISVEHNILEFKGHGKFGEKLHNYFDDIVNIMHIMEDHEEVEAMTTWHNDETLAKAFWQCFFVTCLPDTANFENISILCTDINNVDRSSELANYIKRLESGWLPD